MSLTAHCLIKNEENFIEYAVLSVIDFVDQILIFDTGSTDKTVHILKRIQKQFPDKVIFEEKGECDKIKHTQLRQEMLDRTNTEWFMVLDGDEVWTRRAMEEAVNLIKKNKEIKCIITPFYLCVGDVFHAYPVRKNFSMLGKKGFFTVRFFQKSHVRWVGEYGVDTLVDSSNSLAFNNSNSLFLKEKFWHLTHLERSSLQDDIFSSGGYRTLKLRETYFLIGRKIQEDIPEVFDSIFIKKNKLFFLKSLINFIIWSIRRLMKSFGN